MPSEAYQGCFGSETLFGNCLLTRSMNDWTHLTTLLGWAFATSNAIRALFYVPQIRAVARSNDGARDIALSTWWMWLVNNLLGTAYCLLVLDNVPLACSFIASIAGCACLISLTVHKRRGPRASVSLET